MHVINPMHQFEVHRVFNLSIFNYNISITNSSLVMILIPIISIILIFFFIKNRKIIPSKMQALFEILIKTIYDNIDANFDNDSKKYVGFIFSIFFFILCANILGLIPYSFTSTSHISVTFSLAMIVFTMTLLIAFIKHGIFFFKIFVPKNCPLWLVPLLFLLEAFSFFIRPISLAIRLSSNMIAGHVMLEVLAFFTIMLKVFGFLPLILLTIMIGFEFCVAILQSYIFAIFSSVYINEALHH